MTLAVPRWLSVVVSTLALFAALGIPQQQAHAQFCTANITSGNQAVCVGDPVTITATISNPGGATVRWFRGATLVQTGGTSYTIASATTTDAGPYTVTLTGGAFNCNTTSLAAALTVRTQVAITNQPDSINRATAANASFSVSTSGTSPTFQWRRNGVNLINGINGNGTVVAGATTATLTLTSVAVADAGNYTVVVDNACNTVISAAAVLSVFDPVGITVQPVSVSACNDETVNFTVSVNGSATGRTFQWRKDGVNLVNGIQANGTVVSGATSSSLSLAGVKESDEADYTCFITNIVSSATSTAAALTVFNPPAIIGGPSPQSVCPADNVNFSVLVISSPAPTTFQWQRNGVNLVNGVNVNGTTVSGATTSTLTLTSVASGDAGTYRCVVRNGCPTDNQTTSLGAVLTINTGVTTTSPANTTACELGTTSFTITVTGTPAPTIQWRRNGVNLVDGAAFGSTFSGVNTTTLSITSLDPAAAGNYDAVVSNACDTDNTAVAVLTIRNQIAITLQPLAQTICEFGNTSFTVAATGAGPISYQWQRNGVNLANGVNASGTTIAGATTPILSLTSADPDDDGTYRCVVSNDCDTDFSLGVALTVRPQVIITTPPADQTVCSATTVNFSVAATGAGPLTFQWRRNGVNLVNGINVNGTTVSGATAATLTLTSVDTADSGDYTCAVTNAAACDTDVSAAGTLVVNAANLIITVQPLPATVCEGNNAAFTIAATGGGLTYQWRRNGVNLVNGVNANGTTVSGATTPTLSLTSVDPDDAGSYTCVVANNCDTDISSTALLTVNPDTRFTVTPADRVICPGSNTSFTVAVSGTAPFTFQWRRNGINLINGVNGNGTTISGAQTSILTLSSVAAADAGAYDCVVAGACSTANSIDADLVVATGVTITGQPASALNFCQGSDRVFSIAVSGTPTPTIQWQRNGVNIANGPTGNGSTFSGVTTTSLTISNVQPGDAATYRALVSTVNTSGTTCDAEFTSAATLTVNPLPTVTSISSPTTVCPGGNVSRVVITTNATAFQWRRNGVNLTNGAQPGGGSYAGVNTSTLSILGITNALGGDYTCVVSNACGPVTSPISTVTVRDTVSILASPSDQTITEGGSASFTVAAAGTGPLSFQWQRNNSNIANGVSPNGTVVAGATTATLDLSNVSALDAGNFRCVVTNICGSVNSLSALLTVNPVSSACSVADIVGIGGTPPPDGLLTGDDFNAFIAAFAASNALADITGIGGPPNPPDGLITGDDFNAFIAAFAAGCP